MTSTTIQAAVQAMMASARQAVDDHGVTSVAMQQIEQAMRRLAGTPGLKDEIRMDAVHGTAVVSTTLASEGRDGLTLVLACFPVGSPTPVHDHGTWGAIYTFEGHDRYIHYERLDQGQDPDHAQLRIQYERLLGPGDFVYYLDPPHDIHNQEAQGEDAWELVLFGKNAMQLPRRYYDTATGQVTTMNPQ